MRDAEDLPLPAAAGDVAKAYPDLYRAYAALGDACAKAGPIDAQAQRLVKLALAIGTPGYGEVLVRLRTRTEEEPLVRLGRDYQLDGELAERLADIDGLDKVSLTTRGSTGHLRLVA